MTRTHKDLPPGAQQWAREMSTAAEKVKHLEAVVQRLSQDLGVTYNTPERPGGPVPSVENPIKLKLSALQDLGVHNVQDGNVLTWDVSLGKWVARAPKAGGAGFELTNYWPDPTFQNSSGDTKLLYNACNNPTPTLNLDGWASAGTATLSRDAAATIVGMGYGIRVTSPDASSGVKLPVQNKDYLGQSVYVRAVTACTLTIGVEASVTATLRSPNWGSYKSWGEEITPVAAIMPAVATYTFAAGELKRVRSSLDVPNTINGGTWDGTSDFTHTLTIKGSGTFDVDGAWAGIGVDDEAFPVTGQTYGGKIASTAPFFCGDSAADDNYTYTWEGAPYASRSVRHGKLPTYFPVTNAYDATYSQTFCATLPGGEHAVGLQAPMDNGGSTYLSFMNGADLTSTLALTVGTTYTLSFDVLFPYRIDLDKTGPGSPYYQDCYYQMDGFLAMTELLAPYRQRIYLPFTASGSSVPQLSAYNGWLLGAFYLTNFSLVETPVYYVGSPDANASIPLDIPAGTDVIATFVSMGTWNPTTSANDYSFPVLLQYQTSPTGVWTTLVGITDTVYHTGDSKTVRATVPSTATGVRLFNTASSSIYDSIGVYGVPEPFFDGDTPEDDLYTYEWLGAPHASASRRNPK